MCTIIGNAGDKQTTDDEGRREFGLFPVSVLYSAPECHFRRTTLASHDDRIPSTQNEFRFYAPALLGGYAIRKNTVRAYLAILSAKDDMVGITVEIFGSRAVEAVAFWHAFLVVHLFLQARVEPDENNLLWDPTLSREYPTLLSVARELLQDPRVLQVLGFFSSPGWTASPGAINTVKAAQAILDGRVHMVVEEIIQQAVRLGDAREVIRMARAGFWVDMRGVILPGPEPGLGRLKPFSPIFYVTTPVKNLGGRLSRALLQQLQERFGVLPWE